ALQRGRPDAALAALQLTQPGHDAPQQAHGRISVAGPDVSPRDRDAHGRERLTRAPRSGSEASPLIPVFDRVPLGDVEHDAGGRARELIREIAIAPLIRGSTSLNASTISKLNRAI
nr:hypothetical protein [Myxococcota bacterium]